MNEKHGNEVIYGRQPVLELLRAGRREVRRIVMFHRARPSEAIKRIRKLTRGKGLRLEEADHPVLDRLVGGANHQGVAAEAGAYPYIDFESLPKTGRSGQPLWLLLDHIQDPQNLGAILRSADAVGVDAVLIPRSGSALVTPAVTRVSAGASEHLMICQVANLHRAMLELQDQGCRLAGLEMQPDAEFYSTADLQGPLGVVIGSEGEGLGRLIRDTCDGLVKIPMHGKINSLNASAATAVILYEILRQRGL